MVSVVCDGSTLDNLITAMSNSGAELSTRPVVVLPSARRTVTIVFAPTT